MTSNGFGPIAGANARVLVLGSLPGRLSLEMGQYYAQPRNAFWPIMARIHGFDPALAYELRVAELTRGRVALWDVCASAERIGSLDSSIVNSSVRPNDFGAFFAEYPAITAVYFNGKKAALLYEKRVMPDLAAPLQQLEYLILPSTSPAHAGMDMAEKVRRWSVLQPASVIQ